MKTLDVDKLISSIKACVAALNRDGVVVATSGGIDSATVLKLSQLAVGEKNIRAIFLPDGASSPDSIEYAKAAAAAAHTELLFKDISPAVAALTSDSPVAVVKKYYKDFDPETEGYSIELALEKSMKLGTPVYELARGKKHSDSTEHIVIEPGDLRAIIANTNVKQRLRMICAYQLAETLHYAVGGTSNKDEAQFGFAVKYGDEASDFYPIIGLNKTSVFALAKEIGVPQSIIDRIPTTDTYGLKQTQQKFFFGIPADVMRIAMDKNANNHALLAACKTAGINCEDADSARELVKYLAGSGVYNSSKYIFSPSDWSFHLR